ncbi:Protein PLANT CADMIUM RESISTANCE 10 [Hibiscus syriacus]|uniref:Protein PLANT CADMIUM RESISTANCE 10 n=1 Tax=Hibiscus syriacus TaxID=106335 RepID=A0A6A2X497_HIBSY|nr:protein PLANT CADMIUM RESISTANCE 10 [Hibiscus syriacus]KAE8669903.1 Protein PLANT CADMIUM RESISTANCE 10 [Hibiscus syriacus]
MENRSSYVPPPYIPLAQSDEENPSRPVGEIDGESRPSPPQSQSVQWSSGICACCDDMQSCCIGLLFPCYLFGKNAEFLGSGTLVGSCITHFILWAFANTLCCVLTQGFYLALPGLGCFISCYACGYRRTLRSRYNLQEAPCGDFATHFFCHLCAICQEYREIRERAGEPKPPDLNLAVITAPDVQTM